MRPRSARTPPAPEPSRRGYTLVEVMVVTLIIAILAVMTAPSFQHTLERSRADLAAANLRAIWTAERLYKLDHEPYASLDKLCDPMVALVDRALSAEVWPYTYHVNTGSDGLSFTATARRQEDGVWSGTLTIDESGVVDGTILRCGVPTIEPGYQFVKDR